MSSGYTYFKDLKATRGIKFSYQHIKRLQKAGRFPLQTPLGPNTKPWANSDLDDYEEKCRAERDRHAAALKQIQTSTA